MKTAGLLGVVLFITALLGGGAYLVLKADGSKDRGAKAEIVNCDGRTAKQYMVTIERNVVSPAHIDAGLCGRLTIVNRDDRSRLVAFGVHDSHQPYDGVKERVLSKDQRMTVTLNQPGDYLFHDHFDDAVQGTFTVR